MALTDEEVVHLINQATDFPKLSSTAAEIAQLVRKLDDLESHQMVDTRLTAKPKEYEGCPETWSDWSFVVHA